jgi:uncharacterized protein (DUF849 family)
VFTARYGLTVEIYMFNFLLLKGYLVGVTVDVDTLQNMAEFVIISNRTWSMLMRKQTSLPHCQEKKSCVRVEGILASRCW